MSNLFDLIGSYGLFIGIPILFLAIVLWVYRPGARRDYRKDARIPFQEKEISDPKPPPMQS